MGEALPLVAALPKASAVGTRCGQPYAGVCHPGATGAAGIPLEIPLIQSRGISSSL